jgi:hypothetical protein
MHVNRKLRLAGAWVAVMLLGSCGGSSDAPRAATIATSVSTTSTVPQVGASLRPSDDAVTTTTLAAAEPDPPSEDATPTSTVPPIAVTPALVLDLSNWKLTLPTPDTRGDPLEIEQPELATFSDENFRVTGRSVTFTAPVTGATTPGSKYPRSELREMTNGGRSPASWSSTSGTHVMEIVQLISQLPGKKQELVAGQIHDAEDDVVMIRLEDEDLFVEHDGERLADLATNYILGSTFVVRIEASDGHIRVSYNGELKLDYPFEGSGLYFKAGVYTQSNADNNEPPGSIGQVVISRLQVTHS